MSSEKKSPPTIVPKVVPPRPDDVTGTASRPAATNGTARPAGGGTTSGAPTGANAPVPPPPATSGPAGGNDAPVPPPPASNGGTARSGALKAAAAAMATAKAAAKKLSDPAPATARTAATSPAPAEPAASPAPAAAAPATPVAQSTTEIDDRTVPRVTKSSTSTTAPGGTQEVPAMHYTAAGFSGAARPVTGTTPAAAPPATAAPAAATSAAAPSKDAKPASRPASDGPRRVRLTVSRVDPWSVMKLSFLLAVAIGIMTVVATAVFWTVLDGMGVFTEVNSLVESIVGKESPVDVLQFVEFNRVVALSTLIAIVNMVLITALSTIMAFIYNLVAAMVGGIHLTMTDD
ncbi:DUF3566 domain-containing protein [Oerskovia enterophila]|uniref:DUF3566 domain-containing protein n=1 Tax=Oerskovia enterophila TaxID=43678 RepID=UPI003396FCDD